MPRNKVDVAAILGGQLAKVSDSDTETRWIETDKILHNKRNFYPRPTNLQLSDLADSIKANGILEPPTVVADEEAGCYRLISGHSRMEAVRLLQSQEPDNPAYQKILCRVLPPMDEATELSAVIEANRQRIKPDALLAREAQALTEAYIKRREAGEELPGRIRYHVAEAMQISKTKLANLSAIQKGLKVPGIVERWENQEIPEAAALEIARLPVEAQYRLLDWVIDGHHSYSMRDVKKFAVMWGGCMHKCPESSGFCTNAEAIYNQDYHGGEWSGAGCCMKCLARDTCQAACGFARPHEPEEGAGGIAPPPKLENRVELSAEDWQVRRERFSERLRAARESTGLDRAAFAEKIGEYKATYSAWENGNLPGSSAFPRLAQALGVSTDYLYGLTDDPAPKQWQPLDEAHWPADGQLVAIAYENPLGGTCYLSARCVGGYHDIYPFEDTDVGCELDEPSHGDYEAGYWWIPLPEKEEKPNA